MINLIYTPQRNDYKAEYVTENDILTVKINDKTEIFNFSGLVEGKAEEIIVEDLPINPIINAEKIGEIINIKVIQFYGETEKKLFEGVR